jgi:hypothetical protein
VGPHSRFSAFPAGPAAQKQPRIRHKGRFCHFVMKCVMRWKYPCRFRKLSDHHAWLRHAKYMRERLQIRQARCSNELEAESNENSCRL